MMRTTDTISIPALQQIATLKSYGYSKDALLHAIAELYEPGDQKNDTYPVTVDYSLSLAEMIEAGDYNYINSDINARNFPIKETGKVEVNLELIHLNCDTSTNEVLAHMESHGLRPATLAELLALGAKYPELQREFPIVALGSSWVDRVGRRDAACLWDDGGCRSLHIYWCELGWSGCYRFLAVRK